MWHLIGQSRVPDCFCSLPVTFHTESWVNKQNKDTSLSPMCLLIFLCLDLWVCMPLNSQQTLWLHKKHVFVWIAAGNKEIKLPFLLENVSVIHRGDSIQILYTVCRIVIKQKIMFFNNFILIMLFFNNTSNLLVLSRLFVFL